VPASADRSAKAVALRRIETWIDPHDPAHAGQTADAGIAVDCVLVVSGFRLRGRFGGPP
jgi:hypothetical protein